ncbi:MAG: hypothetical protein HYY13_03180 [Nitrospirae bacterium]|nr:hypothetical protein [Nitrospirota bacterium]
MSRVERIEAEIAKLKPAEARRLAKWLEKYFEDEWDKQIEEDAKAGRLDSLIEEAIEDHRQGKTRAWP